MSLLQNTISCLFLIIPFISAQNATSNGYIGIVPANESLVISQDNDIDQQMIKPLETAGLQESSSSEPILLELHPSSPEPSSSEPNLAKDDLDYDEDTISPLIDDDDDDCDEPQIKCDETIDKEGDFSSPNYPNPYPVEMEKIWCIEMPEGQQIDIQIPEMDIDPQHAYIMIHATEDMDAEPVFVTGQKTMKVRYMFNNRAYIKFHSFNPQDGTHKGFKIQVKGIPDGEISTEAPPTTTPPPYRGEYVSVVKELIMSVDQKENPETFSNVIKQILVESTNDWLEAHNISDEMERCRLENVIVKAMPCPKSWPKNNQCVKLEYGIPLNESDSDPLIKPPSDITINSEYELSAEHLNMIWREFALEKLRLAGFDEYKLPNADVVLLVWTSVSLVIIAIFICVLYGIWKTDFFKDYRRMTDEKEEEIPTKRESNLDPSQWPSPNQVVPPFLAEQGTFTGYEPKFVIDDEDELFSSGQMPRINEEDEIREHPLAYNNPFAAEIEDSEKMSSFQRNF